MSERPFNPKQAVVIIFAHIGKELHKAEHIAKNCEQQLLSSNDELTYDEDSDTSFRRALASVNVWNEKVLELGEQLTSWQDYFNVMAKMAHLQAVMDVQNQVKDADKLRALIEYIKVIENLHTINKDLQLAMDEHDNQQMLDLYLKIYEPGDSTYCILSRASVQDSSEMRSYVMQMSICSGQFHYT